MRGLRKHGGKLLLNSPVTAVLEGPRGRASGVALKSGAQIVAKRAVVSNASLWDTQKLVPSHAVLESFRDQVRFATRSADGKLNDMVSSSCQSVDLVDKAPTPTQQCGQQYVQSQQREIQLYLHV